MVPATIEQDILIFPDVHLSKSNLHHRHLFGVLFQNATKSYSVVAVTNPLLTPVAFL